MDADCKALFLGTQSVRCLQEARHVLRFVSYLFLSSTVGEFYWILLHGFDTYGVGNYGFTVSGSALFN